MRSGRATSTGWCRASPHRRETSKCRDQFVQDFGRRAFRRPLTDSEAAPLRGALQRAGSEDRPVSGRRPRRRRGDAAIAEVPLSRRSAARTASSATTQIASRLAYFLWDTMPDQRLFDAAAKASCGPPKASSAWRGACSISRPPARPPTNSSRSGFASIASLSIGEGSPPLSGVHAGTGRHDGPGNAHAAGQPGVERRQFHGGVHGRVQLPELRSREPLRRAGAIRASSSWCGSRPARTGPGSSATRRSSRRTPDRSRPHRPRAAFSSASSCCASTCRIRRPA